MRADEPRNSIARSALVLTMLDTHGFFVAQAAFGAGALASMADAVVRIRAYRRGFTP